MTEAPQDVPEIPTDPPPSVERTMDTLIDGARPSDGSPPSPELTEAAMHIAAELKKDTPSRTS